MLFTMLGKAKACKWVAETGINLQAKSAKSFKLTKHRTAGCYEKSLCDAASYT